MTLTPEAFLKLRTSKNMVKEMSKNSGFRLPSTSNMANGTKHCWNLKSNIFPIIIDHCESNWVGKSLSYWYAKILGLFVNTLTLRHTYSLLNRDKLKQPIQMQLSLTKKHFLFFFCVFELKIKRSTLLKKRRLS